MLKMCSSKIVATATKVAQATKLSALMLGGGAATVAAVSVLVSASGASALDFNFSFFGNEGTTGTTTGRIYGLVDNATSAATGVQIFSNPVSNYYNGQYTLSQIFSNQFTVTNGAITAANFLIYDQTNPQWRGVILNWGAEGLNLVGSGGETPSSSYNKSGFGGATYQQATAEVPFEFDPAFGAALGLPLFIGLRYLKRTVASKKLKYNPTVPVS